MERGEIMIDNLKTFLLGGHAILTCENPEKGTHITFKILKSRINEETYDVWVLISPDTYGYMGTLRTKDNLDKTKILLYFIHTSTNIGRDSKSGQSFRWLILNINRHISSGNSDLNKAKFYHEGKCCVCGKTLTSPESIKDGIGPTCKNK